MVSQQPVVANEDGTFSLNLDEQERALITTIIPELRWLVDDDPDDEMLARLFPTARPDDIFAEVEYQQMVREDLVSARLDRFDMVTELSEATVIDQEQLAAWTGAVNDMRLVLGTRLNITEDDDFEFDDQAEDDPESVARSAYWYLGWLLEHLVEASTSTL